MANADTPFGLRPVQHRNGAPYNGACRPYYIPAAYGTALYLGDPVVITGAVNTAAVKAPGAGSFPVGALPIVAKATAGDGNAITGVIVGFAGDADDPIYNPANTERVVMVADDPDLVFEIQCDGTLTPADVGSNAVLIYTHSGSTSTGRSGAELDTTSDVPAADASNQLTIRAFVNREDNDMAAANSKVLVTINQHTYATGVIGI